MISILLTSPKAGMDNFCKMKRISRRRGYLNSGRGLMLVCGSRRMFDGHFAGTLLIDRDQYQ